jgi:hypothetical protein
VLLKKLTSASVTPARFRPGRPSQRLGWRLKIGVEEKIGLIAFRQRPPYR